MSKEFYKGAWELGLTEGQANGILQKLNAQKLSAFESDKKEEQIAAEKSKDSLAKEWGSAYDERVAIAGKAYNTFVPEEIRNIFHEEGLEDNPNFIKVMAGVGMRMIEDRTIAGSGGVKNLIMTPEEALLRIDKIRNDKDHPYNKRYQLSRPEQKRAVEEVAQLYEFAHPK